MKGYIKWQLQYLFLITAYDISL